MINTGALAGRTVFISGASRGIGEAIAVKCARDGANVAIAAKTAEPHPKLPGTIYTVAEKIEKAGGKALPCLVDIRDESAVQKAVAEAAKTFGGIDICINNASAISLTGTAETPMKRFDLMMGINTRGTYCVTQACLPHLKKSSHAHVLNNSPPLNMSPIWFKNHVAYTMAKYGMSMCVLGMAEELKDYNIGVNAIWPATAIATAAIDLIGGAEMMKTSRKPDIMADAAYAILCRDPTKFTGNFCIDEEIVQSEGVTDLDQYHHSPGEPLSPDFFLGDSYPAAEKLVSGDSGGSSGGISEMMNKFRPLLTPEVMNSTAIVFAVDFGEGGKWTFDMKDKGTISDSDDSPADVTFQMTEDVFVSIVKGEIQSTAAFMSGKMKIKGNLMEAMKLEGLFKKMRTKL